MVFDLAGTLASLLSTLLFMRVSPKAWLVSLVAIGINGYLYLSKGIFADAGLELVYLIATVYGWMKWRQQAASRPAGIKILSLNQWIKVLAAVTVLFYAIGWFLSQYTDSTVVRLDALTAALSLAAQFLMCFKFTGTWILWLITDALYAWLYHVKNLPFHMLLMGIYTLLAVGGYLLWMRRYQARPSPDIGLIQGFN